MKQDIAKENLMRGIRLSEMVLSCGGVGEKLERAVKLLKIISGREPIKTLSKRRIPTFGIRPGLEIGCKVTLKGKNAEALLKRLLEAVGNQLTENQIGQGQLNFGIHEYIEIPGIQFQRDIGIMGFDIAVNLARAGSRIGERKSKKGRVPLRHRISKEETRGFMETRFNTKIISKKKKEE
jgi:large subunit ribosomal protein L5